ncbi:hypothetical protein [Dyella mobilis]|uniref:Uncharacterized protein n=1 Tax=Dyella mobilis TaxID=1849582 RepID=A0ABS2KIP0_9GAMM|nr:hypothetical protein [Dyella mobilis]MBM7131032.1 hypothetical protein [Dyella mobilis]GLQ97659.1 hypothetical protein GCM10007863_20790 [Dyella mobilis]
MHRISVSNLFGSNQPARGANVHAWEHPPIVDLCTVEADYGHLLALTSDGALVGMNLDTGICNRLCSVALPALQQGSEGVYFSAPGYGLHASSDGRYAAVVVDRGREGIVVEVATGTPTMRLDGGDYHQGTVPFSACFLSHRGRDLLVHRTAWNRLDVADPVTGKSLTERDDEAADHHLDYFHGQLRPNPDGSRLFDDGWVWHPVSMPRAWSVRDWLETNPWESEDGTSAVYLTTREDWGFAACWIDNRHVAIWGLANWDGEEFQETAQGPGVRILDATQREQSSERRLAMDLDEARVVDLFSDGVHLYVASLDGTTIWHIESGKQVAEFSEFTARLHHRGRKALIAIRPGEILEFPVRDWADGDSER